MCALRSVGTTGQPWLAVRLPLRTVIWGAVEVIWPRVCDTAARRDDKQPDTFVCCGDSAWAWSRTVLGPACTSLPTSWGDYLHDNRTRL